jgi:hypothetical protein
MVTLKQLAEEALGYFERRTRESGAEYYATKDNRPGWVYDLIYSAHGDMLPDDYKYRFIRDALGIISDNGGDDDVLQEALDQSVDVYTSDLTHWLASAVSRVYYISEVLSEYGGDIEDGFRLLMMAQYNERREVLDSVLQSLMDRLNEIEEEEGE